MSVKKFSNKRDCDINYVNIFSANCIYRPSLNVLPCRSTTAERLRDPRGISAGRRQQRAEGGGAWLSLRSRRLPPARSETSQSPAASRREREQLKRHHIAINTNVVSSSIKIRFKGTVLAGIPPLVIFFSPIVYIMVSGSIAKIGSNSQVSKTLGG
jgi:hypothetical protein